MDNKEHPKAGKDTRNLIYDISVASYPLTISRIDAANARTQTILTIASTLAVACAVIATDIKESGETSHDFLLYLVAIAYIKILIVGMWTMLYGKLSALRPKTLQENYRGDPPEQFMDEVISDAALSMDENLDVANWKHRLNVVALSFLGAQVLFMGIWLMTS